ncbi:hypothetical protein [Bosea sp. (in: a-proteobacteria)]|uniref:hypothetical protein n=1 Tax=Bosea sp. (in: a-proteobacteria) TaxID=1871050 RepID=UPI0011F8DCF8|nr:hypothetical protein [Bosea sp. (in: a-proteobacteria)]TAJ33793.1 MAG: hypothetical protein EPO59_03975 [Bosea sp. (in: a-proteobacteria)]
MTIQQPRGPNTALTLSSLTIDDRPGLVVDELEALAFHEPTRADYAAFAANLPAIPALTRRTKHHADQAVRFITLVGASSREQFNNHALQLFAVARLNVVGSLAVALVPARTAADRHAKREQCHAVLGALEDGVENELYEVARIAFGLDRADAAEIASDAIAYAGRKADDAARESGATTHGIEQRAALAQYLIGQPDAGTLLKQALRHREMEERFAVSLNGDDLGPEEHDRTEAARFGAHLQMIIALARLRLTNPEIDPGKQPSLKKAVAEASAPEQAALLLALEQGRHLEAMMAKHPF